MIGTCKEKLKKTEASRVKTLKEKNKLDAAIRRAIRHLEAEDLDNAMIELCAAINKKVPLKTRIRTEMVVK